MANDFETILRQNQERADQRKRDQEYKALAYQKLKVKYLIDRFYYNLDFGGDSKQD